MSWSVPVGWCLAIQNGLGAGAYLPLLPAGPLRDLIARRVSEGAIFSDADTDPSGASNELRSTTAVLTADGSAYVINGEKICIGNGPVADFLVVSATVNDADGDTVVFNESFEDVPEHLLAAYTLEKRFTVAKRVTPKRGKMIGFEGKQYHASMHPMRTSHRIAIAFSFL